MNINLEIDDALALRLEEGARARGETTREFIRRTLEQAVMGTASPAAALPAFVQKTHDFGASNDTTWTLLADIESSEHLSKQMRK